MMIELRWKMYAASIVCVLISLRACQAQGPSMSNNNQPSVRETTYNNTQPGPPGGDNSSAVDDNSLNNSTSLSSESQPSLSGRSLNVSAAASAENMTAITENLTQTAENVNQAAENVNQGAENVSQAAENATTTVEEDDSATSTAEIIPTSAPAETTSAADSTTTESFLLTSSTESNLSLASTEAEVESTNISVDLNMTETDSARDVEEESIFDDTDNNNNNDTLLSSNNITTTANRQNLANAGGGLTITEDEAEDDDGGSGAKVLQRKTEGDSELDNLRKQMVIATGVIGGIVVLLIILVLALAISVSRIKSQFGSKKHERYIPSSDDTGATSPVVRGSHQEIHAYDNSAFNNGAHEMEERRVDSKAEVERLGYEMYNGRHENRQDQPASYKLRTDRFLDRAQGVNSYNNSQQGKRYSSPIPRASTSYSPDYAKYGGNQLRMEEGVAPMTHSATPTHYGRGLSSGGGIAERRDQQQNQQRGGYRF